MFPPIKKGLAGIQSHTEPVDTVRLVVEVIE